MKKKLTAAICAAMSFCMALSVTACGGGGDGNGEKTSLRIFTFSGNEYEGVTMDSAMKAIEDKVGVKMMFEGASEADYYTKLTPMINTQDWPDIIWCDPENSSGAFQTWSDPKQEILYNLDDLLTGNAERYPYLTRLLYSDQYKNIMYHDGHYIVPMVQTSTAWAIYWRADWLEQIGFVDDNGNAKAPVTLKEFEEVMKKFSGTDLFTYANGKKSGVTYGISPNTSNFYVNPLYGAFGVTPDWDVDENGEVSYMYARENFKEYLKWMNTMYQNGWIDPIFNQNSVFLDRDAWNNGKVGCLMTNGEAHMEWVIGHFSAANGEDKVIVGPPLEGTGEVSALTGCTLGVAGERGYSNWGGYYGGYAITQGAKDPYKALDLLEYLVCPEGSMLRLYGIEGEHYTRGENGKITVNLEGRNSERNSFFAEVAETDGTLSRSGLHKIGGLFGYNVDWDVFEESGKISVATDIGALYPKYEKFVTEAIGYTKYLQTPKMLNVTSFPATIDTRKMECMKISAQFINKAIIGQSNLTSDWDAMIADMNKAGYATVRAVMKETIQEIGII